MPTQELAINLFEETARERDRWHRQAAAAEAENTRLRARLMVAKNRLTKNVPRWAQEWPGIAGAISEIDAAFEGGPLSSE